MNPADKKYDNLDDIMLNTWDISHKAEFADWPSERVTYIRTGLHWELASFVVPFINYAVSYSMVAMPSSVVKLILAQFSQILLQDVPNHIFAAHLM
ncbi:hypothetical protein P692DRAFT_20875985 [Suillus brevipes Sb2]|nr:hypothetical protein P692DRAFT_20875985 [Suillus brevipes Sb2]